ncbi:hypothetical protein BN946_scf184644.g7 [Trametes cinnabarina]|uniref:Uncharacterized protein n=1 Tax=Pycnoporus cinnabarinus TaxID=5643 RepID=A0A060SUT9_PYCCI|nr:hypothetical protein BN946_scf184644.g7 [Trametes cinnabarina]
MRLNGSRFMATEGDKHLVVVQSLAPEVAVRNLPPGAFRCQDTESPYTGRINLDFLDPDMNPAGGQSSSPSDLITLTLTLSNPRHSKGQLKPYARDKWLWMTCARLRRTTGPSSVRMWEIIKASDDANGRLRKIYWKCT